MSFDNQIPVEVSMPAYTHQIDGQYSDSDTDLSLPIDEYFNSDPRPMDPRCSYYGRDYAIRACLENTCGRLVYMYVLQVYW